MRTLWTHRDEVPPLLKHVHLSMRQAVWLFPIAYGLHVLEELPNFTAWAQRYASPSYSMREYLIVHAIGLLVAVLSASVISVNKHRILTFIFFTFIFTLAVFFNLLFHVFSTVIFCILSPL